MSSYLLFCSRPHLNKFEVVVIEQEASESASCLFLSCECSDDLFSLPDLVCHLFHLSIRTDVHTYILFGVTDDRKTTVFSRRPLLVDSGPLGLQGGFISWPAKSLSLRSGSGQPKHSSLPDPVALKVCHGSQDVRH